jgi:ribosomal protein S18 acetylase RimI-like enzyme
MVHIIYRHYEPGDDKQLTDLFNTCFNFIRTPKSWNWRYVQSPNFDPEMCQIAEDSHNKKIVGAVYVNLVEEISIDGKKYLNGDINDVSCLPAYGRRGIAKNLMDMAIEYMKKRNCDISILSADYNGFPRKKIYLKYGYLDIEREYFFINFGNLFQIAWDFPVIASLFPVIFMTSYISRFINRIRVKINPFLKNIKCEIANNKRHFEYLEAAKRILPKYYDGAQIYNNEKVSWSRIKVPGESEMPTYIILRKDDEIIGGALLTSITAYIKKGGFKIRMGLIHEVFLDKSKFDTKRNLYFGYTTLIDKVLKVATRRYMGPLIFPSSVKDNDLHEAFRGMSFLKIKGGVLMMKPIKENIKLPEAKKPIHVPTHSNIGFP